MNSKEILGKFYKENKLIYLVRYTYSHGFMKYGFVLSENIELSEPDVCLSPFKYNSLIPDMLLESYYDDVLLNKEFKSKHT